MATRYKRRPSGYRSKYEEQIAEALTKAKIKFSYEPFSLSYIVPQVERLYRPDWVIPTKKGRELIVESKGRFTTKDRQKMLLVIKTNPSRDIRLLFMADNFLYKGSKTRYTDWCKENGIQCAVGKEIPKEWLK